MSSNHIIYKDKQGEYKLIGQYGNFNTDEIYSLSDIIDAKDGVFLTSNNILQFGLNLGGNVPTQLDSNVTRIVGGARRTQTMFPKLWIKRSVSYGRSLLHEKQYISLCSKRI